MREDEYLTKNLNLASFLWASGVQFVGIKRLNKEVSFIFAPKAKAENFENQYFTGSATINPRELFARLKDLRDIIFSDIQV